MQAKVTALALKSKKEKMSNRKFQEVMIKELESVNQTIKDRKRRRTGGAN